MKRYNLSKSHLVGMSIVWLFIWLLINLLFYSMANALLSDWGGFHSLWEAILALIGCLCVTLLLGIFLSEQLIKWSKTHYELSDDALIISQEGHQYLIYRDSITNVSRTSLKKQMRSRSWGMPRDMAYFRDVGWVRMKFCVSRKLKDIILIKTDAEQFALTPPAKGRQFVDSLTPRAANGHSTSKNRTEIEAKRPIGIIILAVILIIDAILSSVSVILVATTWPPLELEIGGSNMSFEVTPLVMILLVPATAYIALKYTAAIGLFRGANWARTLTLIILALTLIVGIASLFFEQVESTWVIIELAVLAVLIGLFIFLLVDSGVREYFAQPEGKSELKERSHGDL